MFGLDISTADLAGGIAAEEYGSTGLFRVALEHIRTLLQNDGGRRKARARLRYGLVSGREVAVWASGRRVAFSETGRSDWAVVTPLSSNAVFRPESWLRTIGYPDS